MKTILFSTARYEAYRAALTVILLIFFTGGANAQNSLMSPNSDISTNNSIISNQAGAVIKMTQFGQQFAPDADCEINCPADITVNGSGSGAVVDYSITFSGSDCDLYGAEFTMTQNLGTSDITDGIDCSNASTGTSGVNRHFRAYNSQSTDLKINAVEVGAFDQGEGTMGGINMQILVYTYSGTIGGANLNLAQMTLVGQSDIESIPFGKSIISLSSSALIPAGTNFVVEQQRPYAGDAPWSTGTSSTGQTTPAYLMAEECGANTPTSYATLGLSQQLFQVLYVNFDGMLVQTSGLPSGSTFPVGTTTNCFELRDGGGNVIDTCCFDVTVNDGNADCELDCPEDIYHEIPVGDPGIVVDYTVDFSGTDCDETDIETSQIVGYPSPIEDALRCGDLGVTGYHYRAYPAFSDDYNMTGIDVASWDAGQQKITVYSYTGAMGGQFLDVSQMTLIYDSPFFSVPGGQVITHYDFPVSVNIPAGTNFVIRQSSPSGSSGWHIASTYDQETAPSYIGCDEAEDPENYATWSGGYPNVHLYQVLYGTLPGVTVNQTSGLPSGSEFPVGQTTNCFELVDGSGDVIDACCFNVTIEDTLGVQDINFSGFKFYPNPAKNELNLVSDSRIEKVEIFNLQGQRISSQISDSTTAKLNVESLSAGTYMMKVTIKGEQKVFKFIKR